MATLTEIVAAMVVQSSAAAYSHFGVAVELKQPEQPAPAARTVARVVPAKSVKPAAKTDCDDPVEKTLRA
ncbi:MAG TPA: hypothetical protein VIO94_14160 [Phenylobacterium sp.]